MWLDHLLSRDFEDRHKAIINPLFQVEDDEVNNIYYHWVIDGVLN